MGMVLVTGAAGFLGRTLVPELSRRGYDVRALVRDVAPPAFPQSVHIVRGDIRDAGLAAVAVAGCENIVHLAGKAHALDDDEVHEAEYQSINIEGTKRLLEAATVSGVRRFLFASSVKVFGETTSGCVDETIAAAPRTPYARSKWEAEQLVSTFAKQGSFATVSLRLPLVYGPTHKGNLYRMVAAIDRGWFPPIPRVATVKSMLHAKNFVRAVLATLAPSEFAQPMYVATDARPYSVTYIYDRLRNELGYGQPTWRVPLWALSFGARCGDILQRCLSKPIPLTSATFEKLMGEAWYSPAALIHDTAFRPLEDFQAAVPELVRYYRSTCS